MDKILERLAKLISENEEKVIIGISGHGASGKTTFANRLMKRLEQDDVNYLNTDPYIIESAAIRKYAVITYDYQNKNYRHKMTACHPGAHHIQALERDIRMIRGGLDFYTLSTHYKKGHLISSKKRINIIEGMSAAFAAPNLFDATIYLYTDGDTELRRRSSRD